MSLSYLLRFDDLCPTMNWTVWNDIEALLVEYQVAPILAVVPDNQDPGLMRDAPSPDFWLRVQRWQERGWTIAMHGYEHRYVTRASGLMKLKDASEFAGLSYAEQHAKLAAAMTIFVSQGVRPSLWVAPGHSFDDITINALSDIGIRTISDGFSRWPHTNHGVLWIPQQLWEFDRTRRSGIWTICLHHNDWTDRQLADLREFLESHAGDMARVNDVVEKYEHRPRAFSDAIFERCWRAVIAKRLPHMRSVMRRACA